MSVNIPKNAKFLKAVAVYEAMVYNVYTNTDSNEGRGAPIKIGSFADQSDANAFSCGKGVMGCPADVKLDKMEILVPKKPRSIGEHNFNWDWSQAQVCDKLSPFNPVDLQKKREEILKKLSAEEREFLGLK